MNQPLLVQQLDALLADEHNFIANLSNASALLFEELPKISWAGFYLYDTETKVLNLGPFQGKVACMHINLDAGVCGRAFSEQQVLRVADVNQFPGHIACDSASRSEIVLPLSKGDQQIGVLDIDSPVLDRFSSQDQELLMKFVASLINHL